MQRKRARATPAKHTITNAVCTQAKHAHTTLRTHMAESWLTRPHPAKCDRHSLPCSHEFPYEQEAHELSAASSWRCMRGRQHVWPHTRCTAPRLPKRSQLQTTAHGRRARPQSSLQRLASQILANRELILRTRLARWPRAHQRSCRYALHPPYIELGPSPGLGPTCRETQHPEAGVVLRSKLS